MGDAIHVRILSARVVGDDVLVYGTVEGFGHLVNCPKSEMDSMHTKKRKMLYAAQKLKDVWELQKGKELDILGEVTL